MLHADFQGNWPSGSGEEDFFKVLSIFEHGGHLGHVTLDHLYKILFPVPKEAPHKILALIGQAVSEEKMFENGGRRQRQRTLQHGYTISSPMSLPPW